MEDNKKIEEIMKQAFSGPVQLSMADLEKVTGGTLTDEAQSKLLWAINLAKENKLSLETVIGYIPMYFTIYRSSFPDATVEEAEKFIRENW